MPNRRRLNITLRKKPAMHVTRVSVRHDKLVYVLVADKKLRYKKGRSRIVYIGTTKNGVSRVAQSAAYRTDRVLRQRGVEEFEVRIVACRPRQHVKTWRKLERAMLIEFRERYGEVPLCNSHGKKMKPFDELEYFSRTRLKSILEDLA